MPRQHSEFEDGIRRCGSILAPNLTGTLKFIAHSAGSQRTSSLLRTAWPGREGRSLGPVNPPPNPDVVTRVAGLALGTAAEVVRHSPTIWSGIRSGYGSVRKGLSNIKTALSGSAVEDVNEQLVQLADEMNSIVDSLEETTDRIEELEAELERERQDSLHNREVFQAVWAWSQQGWWKRAFSRPTIAPGKLWRGRGAS